MNSVKYVSVTANVSCMHTLLSQYKVLTSATVVKCAFDVAPFPSKKLILDGTYNLPDAVLHTGTLCGKHFGLCCSKNFLSEHTCKMLPVTWYCS